MSWKKSLFIIGLLAILLAGGWFSLMERRWEAEINWQRISKNGSMLAAERLLVKRGYRYSEHESIHQLMEKKLPGGTMFMSSSDGMLLPQQAQALKEWVNRGNTLIILPPFGTPQQNDTQKKDAQTDSSEVSDRTEPESQRSAAGGEMDEENDTQPQHEGTRDKVRPSKENTAGHSADNDEGEFSDNAADSSSLAKKIAPNGLFANLGVTRGHRTRAECAADKETKLCKVQALQLPHLRYPLYLHDDLQSLNGRSKVGNLLVQDERGLALQAYTYGKGHIVLLAENVFTNRLLGNYDHAQILLYLAQINASDKHFIHVKHLDYKPWQQAIWEAAAFLILSLGLCLALSLWIAVRRFGPLLPEPVQERRALIEHVDASARWFWHLPGGPDILLGAARSDILMLLRRRIPDWNKLSPQQQAERLAKQCQIPQAKVWLALFEKPVKVVHVFTEQVQILQTLRKNYERK